MGPRCPKYDTPRQNHTRNTRVTFGHPLSTNRHGVHATTHTRACARKETQRIMGGSLSAPAFYHPDLLAVLQCQEKHVFTSWRITPLLKTQKAPYRPHSADWSRRNKRNSERPRDPDWSTNSPVAIELVDILNGALKDMGGWPICETIRCWSAIRFPVCSAPPKMVEAFKKVCQQVNEAKLFNMGLQCRAGMYKIARYGGQAWPVEVNEFCVLVEKRDDEKLRNVEAMDTLEYKNMLNGPLKKFYVPGGRDFRDHHALVTGWSPPANWIARCYDFPIPSNETTNYV